MPNAHWRGEAEVARSLGLGHCWVIGHWSLAIPRMTPWLHRLALLTALATLALIAIGGLVTSHGAGMAVPDWPTTYGYNMFFFPISQWVGGIFYEHTHRLVASVVGLFTALLAGWIWVRETTGGLRKVGLGWIVLTLGLMGVRTQPMFIALACVALGVIAYSLTQVGSDARPVRWWAAIAFSVVLVQGVLGGLRVTALADWLGIFHGTLAQCFLVLICALALVTGGWWERLKAESQLVVVPAPVRNFLLVTTLLILGQLALGASMRHQHAGLAVPDFPLAHGKVWPATDAASLEAYNRARHDHREFNAITAGQIHLHLAHRLGALIVFGHVLGCLLKLRRTMGGAHLLARVATGWFALLCVQFGLGIWTVLSNKAADIATLHVVVGAASLVTGALLTLLAATVFRAEPQVGAAL
ncbi:MAG: Heme synthase [Verrucomicrobiota bacterium]|jgi:cytochrome c oxidase assembly protein subunit 15